MTWQTFISQIITECAQDLDKLTKYAGPLEQNVEKAFSDYRTHLNPNPTNEAIHAFWKCKKYAQETTLCAKLLNDPTTIDEIKTLIKDNPERQDAIPHYENYAQNKSKDKLKEILAGLSKLYDRDLEKYKKGKKPIVQSITDTIETLDGAYHHMQLAMKDPMELYHFYKKGAAKAFTQFIIELKVKYTPEQRKKVQTAINLIGELEECGRLFDIDKIEPQKVQHALDRIAYLAEEDKKRGYEHDLIKRHLRKFSQQYKIEKPDKERILPLRRFLQTIAQDIVETYERVMKDIKIN